MRTLFFTVLCALLSLNLAIGQSMGCQGPGPTIIDFNDVSACDSDGDGFAVFRLNVANIERVVLGGQTGLTIQFFDENDNEITLSEEFVNTVPNLQIITILVTDANGCSSRTEFRLIVTQGEDPIANPVEPVSSCNLDQNGMASFEFDISDIETQAIGNQRDVRVSFSDLLGNPLNLNEGLDNVRDGELIVVRVTNAVGCFDETTLELRVSDAIEVDELEDVSDCVSYTLPSLSDNNRYFTAPNAEGIELLAGEQITSSQTIYIYTEENGCIGESSFTVTIDENLCPQITELPTFFTPNGDGYNDVWDISALTGPQTITVAIFDRYGKLLVQLNSDSNTTWDGRLNGRSLPASDYWYRYIDGVTGQNITGHFALKR